MESDWLRDAIRVSLKGQVATGTFKDGSDSPQPDPRLHKLVEGLQYSRRLILTYHLIIVGCVLLVSIMHWAERWTRWQRQMSSRIPALGKDYIDFDGEPIKSMLSRRTQDPQGLYSSGSSTIEGSASPPSKDFTEDEDTPLLQSERLLCQYPPQRSIWATTRAFLMYQPAPIPLVNKKLPSNGLSIVLVAFVALNIFYMLFHINFNAFEFFVLADRFGLVFVVNLPLLYLLAAKNQPLKYLTGYSYESLNIFHRRLGELLCLQALLHSGGMIGVWYILIRPNGFGILRFLLLKVIWLGLGAFLSYEVLYFTSLGIFRQRWYELFIGLHVVLQVAALLFVFFHHSVARPYVGLAIAIFAVDRLLYRLWTKVATVEAVVEILEDKETVRLSSIVSVRKTSHVSALFGTSIESGWLATDHVFITVPSLAKKHIVQVHPFTISSAPPRLEEAGPRLDLLIRAQHGFSRDLLNAAQTRKNLEIRLDGPYGSSHARDTLEESSLALIIAGGSGIAVAWPLVQHLLDLKPSIDPEMASTRRQQTIVLIWIIHQGSHLSWLGRQALADAENRGVEIIVPRATAEIGRPDLACMIRDSVDVYAGGNGGRTGVVASGPDSMGRLVRNTCASLVRDGKDLDLVIEKFGW